MSPAQNDGEGSDLSRKSQTFFLSAEFLITMLIQTGVLLVVGTSVVNGIDSRVSSLEAQQVTAERIARIEEKMSTMISNQQEAKVALSRVQDELRAQRRE